MNDEVFDEGGALTSAFLLARGYCCGNGCRNCPYIPRHGGVNSRPEVEPASSLDPEVQAPTRPRR